jgi:hypothetical protein
MNVSEETAVPVFRLDSSNLICPEDGNTGFLKNAVNYLQGLLE